VTRPQGIAIIGWGSLIWDLEILEPQVAGPWRMAAGPRLPMEFSRISAKRKMGLAVCLDAEHGAVCMTHWIRSARGDVAAALDDLAARERAPGQMIGAVCALSGDRQGRPEIAEAVADWCDAVGVAGAVWTDLRSNYAEHRGRPFSIADAVAYLKGLSGESLDEAVRYIQNAPPATDTTLRRVLADDPWWRREAARVAALDVPRD